MLIFAYNISIRRNSIIIHGYSSQINHRRRENLKKYRGNTDMAKKTLEEMLIERAERAELTGRWAAFMAAWDEIQDAHRKGWNFKEIWTVLHEANGFGYSYSSFMACVKRMKLRRGDGAEVQVAKPAPRSTNSRFAAKPSTVPGSNRVDLPLFGEGVKERDPKRF